MRAALLVYLLIALAVIGLLLIHRSYKLKKERDEMLEEEENLNQRFTSVKNMRSGKNRKSKANLHVVDKTPADAQFKSTVDGATRQPPTSFNDLYHDDWAKEIHRKPETKPGENDLPPSSSNHE